MALAAALNRSFASPVLNFDYPAAQKTANEGLLLRVYDGISGFSVFVTLILVLVAYDQCKRLSFSELLDLLRLIRVQSNMYGTRAILLVQHGRHHFLGPSFRQYTRGWMSTKQNGQAGI